ncbi:hypothetical protein GZL_03221 [Streptomyces sp. 769]|nr:hypothetical protein GZL_03221 [Streptomyces sp. 769]
MHNGFMDIRWRPGALRGILRRFRGGAANAQLPAPSSPCSPPHPALAWPVPL